MPAILSAILLNQQYCLQYCQQYCWFRNIAGNIADQQYCWQYCWQHCWQYCWFSNIAGNIASNIASNVDRGPICFCDGVEFSRWGSFTNKATHIHLLTTCICGNIICYGLTIYILSTYLNDLSRLLQVGATLSIFKYLCLMKHHSSLAEGLSEKDWVVKV